MGLFSGSSHAKNAVVLDIAADSVGGACIIMGKGAPALCYSVRAPLELRAGEAPEQALARGLAIIGEELTREGAPALARASGSGKPERIFASIAAPWAASSVRIERLAGEKGSFVFTHDIIKESLRPPTEIPAGKAFLDENIIATYLDGYESKQPVGERASRVAIIVLSTLVAEAPLATIGQALRALYHTHHIELSAGALTLYRGLEALFPHENDYLALSVSGETATLLLVRKGALLAAPDFTLGQDPATALYNALAELARTQPLPHSVFVVADDAKQERFKAAFADPRFAPIWLSDNPPRVLPVRAEHLTLGGKLSLSGDVRPDIALGLAALFCAQGGT